MNKYSRSHLTDGALVQSLKEHMARERVGTAEVLADLAEVDARKLYLPAAYPSMYACCIGELRFSEEAAYKRIRAARLARKFLAIFAAMADGRLHLSAIALLASYLTTENAQELLGAAANQTDAAITQLLAQRFPRPDVPSQIQAVAPPTSAPQLSVRTVEVTTSLPLCTPSLSGEPAPGPVEIAPSPRAPQSPSRIPERTRVTPLAPERYALQCTVAQSTYEKLQKALALLGHQVASRDLPAVIDRALDALIEKLEKSKFAKTSRPRPSNRRSKSSRHVPAEIKRRVWERDQGRCTFTNEKGQRCPATSRLEFDHVDPVARGGRPSLSDIRLRCRAHNQYEAERTFGVPFMNHKRAEAQRAADVRKAEAAARSLSKACKRTDRSAFVQQSNMQTIAFDREDLPGCQLELQPD